MPSSGRSRGNGRRWPKRTVAERFWAKVDKQGPPHPTQPELGCCWLWTGAQTKEERGPGYGAFRGPKHQWVRAHRMALTLAKGPPPNDVDIYGLHSCDRSLCCNPAHLRWGDQGENLTEVYARYRRGPKRIELHGEQQELT